MNTQVLIIGGGFAGVAAAQELEKKGIQTLLVDRKNYFEVTYAVLRDAADPAYTNNESRKLYKDILTGKFVQSGVQELRHQVAILENGDHVHFEKVIVASGSRYPSMSLAKSNNAIDLNLRNKEMAQYHQQLKSASDVLIIGGGVVGVELAGEIAYSMPNLNVTLAHNTSALLDGFKQKAQNKAYNQLTKLGVNVELNTLYQANSDVYVDQNSGKTRTADMVFIATGAKPNNEFLKQNFQHILDNKGSIVVDENLAVVDEPGFYAIGDIAAVGEAKLGYLAHQQGTYLGKTIANEMLGKRTKAYKRNPFMALVPTGQKSGVVQLPFAVTTWKPLVNMKQKDLFISKTYNAFNV